MAGLRGQIQGRLWMLPAPQCLDVARRSHGRHCRTGLQGPRLPRYVAFEMSPEPTVPWQQSLCVADSFLARPHNPQSRSHSQTENQPGEDVQRQPKRTLESSTRESVVGEAFKRTCHVPHLVAVLHKSLCQELTKFPKPNNPNLQLSFL